MTGARAKRLAVLAVAVLSVAACGDDGDREVAESTPELEAMLLTVDDLPTGWSELDLEGGEADTEGCLFVDGDDADYGITGRAMVAFSDSGGFPQIQHVVTEHEDLDARWAEWTAELEACEEIRIEDATGTLGRMSFPDLGREAVAYSATLEGSDGFPVDLSMVSIRGDTAMSGVILIGSDVTVLEDAAEAAVGRLGH